MTRRGLSIAILTLGSALATACGDDGSAGSGTDGSSSGEPSTSNTPTSAADGSSSAADDSTGAATQGTTTTDAPGSCTGTCAPVIPAGWTGPVKVGGNAVDCNGGFADPAGAFFTDFDPGEDSCTCDCQPVDAACAETIEVQVWGEGGCAGDPDYTFDLGLTACTPFEGPFPPPLADEGAAEILSQDFVAVGAVVVDSGTCEGTASFNEGGFADSVQLCAPTAEPSMCESGGPCIADNSDVCIWQEGEHDCPDGYADATTAYSGSDDQRECGTCDCGAPTGLCNAVVTLQTDACGGGVDLTNADCVNTGASAVTSATYDPGMPAISCGGGTGTAPISGTVEPSGPVTICCAG